MNPVDPKRLEALEEEVAELQEKVDQLQPVADAAAGLAALGKFVENGAKFSRNVSILLASVVAAGAALHYAYQHYIKVLIR